MSSEVLGYNIVLACNFSIVAIVEFTGEVIFSS